MLESRIKITLLESYLETEKAWNDCFAFKPHHLKEGQLQSFFFQETMSIDEYRKKLILRYSIMTDDFINNDIVDPVNKITYAQDIRGGLEQEYFNSYFESHLLPFLLGKYEQFINMPGDSKVVISSFRDFLCETSKFSCGRDQYIHCSLDENTLQEHFRITEIIPHLSQNSIPFIFRTKPYTINLSISDLYKGEPRLLATIPKQYDLVEIMIDKNQMPIVLDLFKQNKDKADLIFEIVRQEAITQHIKQESKKRNLE